jgi:endonuclease/exonuclease/phosphatase family metal-dependent hydrolase
MTRVLSYNILVGGTHRVEELTALIRSGKPDVVGLVEAIDEHVVKTIAENLGMHYRLSGRANDEEGWQGAVLSRLPILDVKIHTNAIITKQPLLEVCVGEDDGQRLTVFVTHLTAKFGQAWAANRARRQEIQELLRIMDSRRGTRHLLMGDFNSLAPGERLKGSAFLRYVTDPKLYYQLKPDPAIQAPDLNLVMPPPLRIMKPLLEQVPNNKHLSAVLNGLDFFYAPRGGIDLLKQEGYADCYRASQPDQQGFTWPAPIPSGRVDFIFASPELAPQLVTSDVIVRSEEIPATQASDHLPVFAEFGATINASIKDEREEYLAQSVPAQH